MNSRNHFAKLLAVSLLTMCSVSSVVIGAGMPNPVVNSNADTGDNDPADAYCGTSNNVTNPITMTVTPVQVPNTCTLRAAIQNTNAAGAGQTITFAANIAGGNTTTLTADLEPVTSPVTIDASNLTGGYTVNGNDQFRAFLFPGTGNLTSGNYAINSLNINNSANATAAGGGAIAFFSNFPSKLTLTNVSLDSNGTAATNATPSGPGGAILIADGRVLTMTGGSITGNSATAGGAIYITTTLNGPVGDGVSDPALSTLTDDVLTLTNVVIKGNITTAATPDGNGGAIYADLRKGGDILLTNVDIGGPGAADANDAGTADGGGLWLRRELTKSDILIRNSTIRGNKAANGGGLTVKRGRVMVENSTFSTNTTTAAGGGIWLDTDVMNTSGGSVRLENVTLHNNTAATAGGAIAAKSDNPASSFVIHTTIKNNSAAAGQGGGLSLATAPNATFPGDFTNPFTNNILDTNTGGNCRASTPFFPGLGMDANNAGYNYSSDATCGFTQATDRQNASPLTTTCAQNQTGTLPTTCALLSGSPAIDATNPVWANAKDERGADRQDAGVDGDFANDMPGLRDAGAYEFGGFGLIEFVFPNPLMNNQDVLENAGSTTVKVHRYGTMSALTSAPTVVVNFCGTVGAACGTAGTATPTAGATNDYVVTTPQNAVFVSGDVEKTFPITITDDTTVEGDESIRLALTATTPLAAAYADFGVRVNGQVTIKDVERGSFQFAAATYSANENTMVNGSGPGNTVTLMVTRTNGSFGAVSLTCDTDLTGIATNAATVGTVTPADYIMGCYNLDGTPQNTITFADGDTAPKPVLVKFIGDTTDEQNETFNVRLGTPTCSGLGGCDARTGTPNPAVVTIVDDDGAASLAINDVTLMEGNMGNTAFVFTITLSPASAQEVRVNYATTNGTAMAGSDYTAVPSTQVIFAAGETMKMVTVNVTGDTVFEGDGVMPRAETFLVNLTAPINAVIGDNQGLGTILDDDNAPQFGSLAFVNAQEVVSEDTAPPASKTKLITVTRTGGTDGTVTVQYAFTNGVAVSNGTCAVGDDTPDYNTANGTLSFGPGVTTRDITVTVCNDNSRESDQKVTLALSNATGGATIGTQDKSVLTIVSSTQPRFQYAQSNYTVREGDNIFATLMVESIDIVRGETVCIPYKTVDGTNPMMTRNANSPMDYTAVDFTGNDSMGNPKACSGSLTYGNGTSGIKTFSVMIFNDSDADEMSEEFYGDLFQPVNVTITPAPTMAVERATVTIQQPARFFLCPNNTVMGCAAHLITSDKETGKLTFVVKRDGDTGIATSVGYQISGVSGTGRASFGPMGDFDSTPSAQLSGRVNFAAGATTAMVELTINPDTVVEGNELFDFMLVNPGAGGTLAGQPPMGSTDPNPTPVFANGTITDDDYRFEVVSVTPSPLTEGTAAAATKATVTVRRVGSLMGEATVKASTVDGTAKAATDYTAVTDKLLTFPAASSADQTFEIDITADNVDELDETLLVKLTMPSPNSTGTPGEAQSVGADFTLTIADDDTSTVSISPAMAMEGDMAAGMSVPFTLTLSSPSDRAITVTYTTTDGTALDGNDYTGTQAGSVTIPANAASGTLMVQTKGDTTFEADETFTVMLTSANTGANTGALVAGSPNDSAVGTITNDDGQPTVSLSIVGNPLDEDAGVATVTATLDAASGQPVTVNLAFTGTATNDTDYSSTDSVITIPAGSLTGSVTLVSKDDLVDEVDETIITTIVTAPGAIIAASPDNAVTTTITDDDATTVSFKTLTQPAIVEGNTGMTEVTVFVTRSGATDFAVTAPYTVGGTAIAADSDAANGNVPIPAGTNTSEEVSFTFNVKADALDEADETVIFTLGTPMGGTVTAVAPLTHTVTITDDDGPTISIADATVVEGNGGAGTTNLVFNVSLSAPSPQPITVAYSTMDGTAKVVDGDYSAGTGTVTFPVNSVSQTITVKVNGDVDDEDNQTLSVNLSAETNATILDGSATGTITDDDGPTLSITNVTKAEGTGMGDTNFMFEVTQSATSPQAVTVDFATADGTVVATAATQPSDYDAQTGTLTFAANTSGTALTQMVTVIVHKDALDEANELFTVTLSNPTNASIEAGKGVGTGTITNDDVTEISIAAAASAVEGMPVKFVLTRSNVSDREIKVAYKTTAGSATDGADYTGTQMGTVTIPANTPLATEVSISIDTKSELIYETDETFTVTLLSSPTNGAVITGDTGTGTIRNDDDKPTLSVADALVIEDTDTGTSNLVFTVTRTGESEVAASATYTLGAAGDTVEATDYSGPLTGTVSIPANMMTATISVPVTRDAIDELDETLTLTLSAPVDATLADGVAVGTIEDNDAVTVKFTTDAQSVTEGDTGTAPFTITVVRTGASELDITVPYTVMGGAGDSNAAAGSFTIPASNAVTATDSDSFAVNGDDRDEANESIVFTLGTPMGGTVTAVDPTVHTVTITDDDTASVKLTAANPFNVSEAAGGQTKTYTISLTSEPEGPVTVAIANGGSGQITLDNTTVTLDASNWMMGETVTVTALDDEVTEGTQVYQLTHSIMTGDGAAYVAATPFDPASKQVAVTVADNDMAGVTVMESGAGTTVREQGGTATVSYKLNSQPVAGSTVTLTLNLGAAARFVVGGVQVDSPITLTFDDTNWDTAQTVTIAAFNNMAVDGNRTALLTGMVSSDDPNYNSMGMAGEPNPVDVTVNVQDNDSSVSLAGPAMAVTEGVNASFTFTRNGSFGALTASFTVNPGTAIAADYTAPTPLTVSWADGETGNKVVNIATVDDARDEADTEQFSVTLTGVTPAMGAEASTVPPLTANATITDNDASPTVRIDAANSDANGTEGESKKVRISLSPVSDQDVTVSYSFSGDAVAADFTATPTGSVTILAGSLFADVTLALTDDAVDEPSETLVLNLTATATNATVGTPASHTLTIADNDVVTVSFDAAMQSVTEGSADSIVTVRIKRTGDTTQSINVPYTVGGSANGTDSNAAAGSVTIAATEAFKDFTFTLKGDTVVEADETIVFTLGTPTGGDVTAVAPLTHTVNVVNDDASTVSIVAAASATEGSAVSFALTLDRASNKNIVVTYNTTNGTASSNDYTAASNATVTINAGDTAATIMVATTADTVDEADETFTVTLASANNGGLLNATAKTSTGTITDDDLTTVSIAPTTTSAEMGNASFSLSLSTASDRDVQVNYSTANGSATAGSDYTAATNASVTILKGETTGTILVPVLPDAIDEANETFTVTLNSASGGAVVSATAKSSTATITDNDAVTVSFDSAMQSVTEGNADSTVTVRIKRTGDTTQSINVPYTVGGSANGTDSNAAAGSVTIAATEAFKDFTFTLKGDTVVEADETIVFTLGTPTGGDVTAVAPLTHTVNVANDDSSVVRIAATASGTEGSPISFALTLDKASNQDIVVGYSTANGTASSSDYTAASATATTTIPAGSTTGMITVATTADTVDEPDETFTVTLTSASNGALVSSTAKTSTGTIADNDTAAISIANAPAASEGGSASFPITLSVASDRIITVTYSVGSASGDTATGSDYSGTTTGTLMIPAGSLGGTIVVNLTADTADEDDESFTVTLTGANNGATVPAAPANSAKGTISDNSNAPTLSVSGTAVSEGNANSVNLPFTVTLAPASGKTVTVVVATQDDTAFTADGDYTAVTSTTLTFAPGETSKTVNVSVTGDSKFERDETLKLNLGSPTNATVTTATASGTIRNDDTAPSVSIADAPRVSEGGNASFTVSIPQASGVDVTVSYATANGTASAPADYTAISSTVTIPAGGTTAPVTVMTKTDGVDEVDGETFTVTISAPNNASLGRATATGSINDLNGLPRLSIADVSITEGTMGSQSMRFTVTLDVASEKAVMVTATTADDTAKAGSDYDSTTQLLMIPAGQRTATFDVNVLSDAVFESTESFFVNLTNASNADVSDAQAVGTIVDPSAMPTITIGSVTVTEGKSGTTPASFTVTLSRAASTPVTVSYATQDGAATVADNDYSASTGTVTFPANSTAMQTITVQVKGDTISEANEQFSVKLSGPSSNATIGTDTGTATISNDDAQPVVSITNAADVTEGDTGSRNASFAVSLDRVSSSNVVVTYSTGTGTGTGTATAGSDYTAATNATVTITAGTTSTTLTVPVQGDVVDELNETFSVALASASNAGVSSTANTAQATIVDDDTATVRIANAAAVTEGGTSMFALTLDKASDRAVEVTYSTGTGSALAGSDYTAASSATATIAAGATTGSVAVVTLNDTADETDGETFTVTLASASNGALVAAAPANAATGSINDNDAEPMLSVNNASVSEGNTGSSNAVFTVTLSAASGKPVTVGYATDDRSATQPGDYTRATGSLSFAAGETSKTISVVVNGDAVNEGDEQFTVTLSAPTNATLAMASTGTGSILNDDDLPTLSVAGGSVNEGNTGAQAVVFTVTLSAASGQSVTVDYATANGSATTADSDYAPASGKLTFAPGDTSKTVNVLVAGDQVDEDAESFTFALANAVNASPTTASATGTINDDDTAAVVVSPSSINVTEGGSTGMFSVVLASQPRADVTIAISHNGQVTTTAETGLRFTSANWDTAQTVTVTAVDDDQAEGAHSASIALKPAGDSRYAAATVSGVTVSLADNDAASLSISASSLSLSEGGATGSYTLVLTSQPTSDVNVSLTVPNGQVTTSPASVIFTSVNWNVPRTITVTATDDASVEPTATSRINHSLSSADAGYSGLSAGSVAVTVTDNDTASVQVVQSGGSTRVAEGGATDTYLLVLGSRPSGNVVIAINSDSQVSASPAMLTFTPDNYNVAQQVTVSAVNDTAVEGPHGGTISHTVTSADASYNGITAAGFAVVIDDNDNPSTGNDSNNGGVAPAPVVLTTGSGLTVGSGNGGGGSFSVWALAALAGFAGLRRRRAARCMH